MDSSRIVYALSWLALLLTGAFLTFAFGRRLHPELLGFPIMLLAAAQILRSRADRRS